MAAGIPIVLVGLHLLVGRSIVEARQRADTFYAVTPERILIVSGLLNLRSLSNDYEEPRLVLRNALRLDRLPDSVQGVRCASPVTTDVLIDCDFRIAAVDFAKLLEGRSYEDPRPGASGSSGFTSEAPFEVVRAHHARTEGDPEFPNGGAFTIWTNADGTQVRVGLYIE